MAITTSEASIFSHLKIIPYDEAYSITAAFKADNHQQKINLSVGVYRDGEGQPWVLPSVKAAKSKLDENHDYLPQDGLPAFIEAAQKLLLGDAAANMGSRLTTVQTVSGTGACHVGAKFLADSIKPKQVWISDPSWSNHNLIWQCIDPGVVRKTYPYYDAATCSFNFASTVSVLEEQAQEGDVIILQACAHNPTGADPSKDQWKALADLCTSKGIIPFFDTAYQGFASGDVDEDAWAVRYFVSRPSLEVCVAQSFSKNFGLYGERVGAFHLIARDPAVSVAARSHMVRILRSEVSCSPSFGCRLVATVLQDESLTKVWKLDLLQMSSRIKAMRQALWDELVALETPGVWKSFTSQIGMFTYTGLSKSQVKRLADKCHIYMLPNGRLSIPGVNSTNVKTIAAAIDLVVREDMT